MAICTRNLCPTLAFVPASDLNSESNSSGSVSSSLSSSLDSLFSEHNYSSITSIRTLWTSKKKISGRRELPVQPHSNSSDPDSNKSIFTDTLVTQKDSDICYDGRDILDLASNIVPYSWQRRTPLLNTGKFTGKIVHNSDDETSYDKYPMNHCITCGFCQPIIPS